MAETKISEAVASGLDATIQDYSVDTEKTDGGRDQKETSYSIENWEKWYGYYKNVPELRVVIDAKSTWTIGKGFKSDEQTEMLLGTIKGNGKDSFNTILENMVRTMHIAGDSFAEVILDDDRQLINLKPIDPSTMTIVVDKKGRIKRYEQKTKLTNQNFKPHEIFHLQRNRTANDMHGTSMVETLEWIILAKNEVQSIMKTIMQRHVKPVMIFHLDTDDATEISAFKTKMDQAYADGENIYVPKDVIVPELLAVAPNATLTPITWLEYLDKQFYKTAGVPMIIVGGSSEFVEKATSIVYLAYQQNVEEDQLYIEEQVLNQLNLVIELEFPVSLENELLSDEKKDGDEEMQPNEAGVGETEE